MNSTTQVARVAGLLYLLASIPGIFALLYVPSVLIVHDDPVTTAHNIAASETLFRGGIVADLVCHAAFIGVVMALYRLFEGVGRRLAGLMVILLVVQIPIVFASEIYHLMVLELLGNAGHAAGLDETQRIAQIALSLRGYRNGMLVDEIFMGLWLFPLGLLIIRSGFLPRLLGVLLFIAGSAYLIESFAWLLLPAYGNQVSQYASLLTALELVIPLWLLVMGAKDRPLPE